MGDLLGWSAQELARLFFLQAGMAPQHDVQLLRGRVTLWACWAESPLPQNCTLSLSESSAYHAGSQWALMRGSCAQRTNT